MIIYFGFTSVLFQMDALFTQIITIPFYFIALLIIEIKYNNVKTGVTEKLLTLFNSMFYLLIYICF